MSYAPSLSEIAVESSEFIKSPNSQKFSSRNKKVRLPQKPARSSNSSNGHHSKDYSILTHCHLCWDWVWQRPQQFMSRLSKRHKVIFVETVPPDAELATPVARCYKPKEYPNLTILRLQFPAYRWQEPDYVDTERRRLVQEFLAGTLAADFGTLFVQWFYDPMAVTAFAGHMGEIATVYDCMDELSRFRFAPPEMAQRERQLLRHADVVFTGGRNLYALKSRSHDNCHFYGCGVDVAHFGKARSKETKVPVPLAALKRPVLGYFGVVDE